MVQYNPITAITADTGTTMRFRYHGFCENHFPIKNHIIKVTDKAFDDFAAIETNREFNRKNLGL